MNFTPFETPRLRLRPQEARDAGFALCIWGDPITGKYLSDTPLDAIDDLNEYMELLRHLSDAPDCYCRRQSHRPAHWYMLRRHQKRRHLLGYRLLHPPHPLAAGLCQRNGNGRCCIWRTKWR